jgi:AcrR family transcriptional regulator
MMGTVISTSTEPAHETPRLREAFRRQMSESVLQAAAQLAIEHGWDKVRIGEVAVSAGVSRPMVYKMFGDKSGLAQALVMTEAERFISAAADALIRHGTADPQVAVAAAVRSALAEGERNPLLKVVLTPGPGGQSDLIRLLTTEAGPILDAVTRGIGAWARAHFPEASGADLTLAIDMLARMAVSHLVLPGPDPGATADSIAAMAISYLNSRGPAG